MKPSVFKEKMPFFFVAKLELDKLELLQNGSMIKPFNLFIQASIKQFQAYCAYFVHLKKIFLQIYGQRYHNILLEYISCSETLLVSTAQALI